MEGNLAEAFTENIITGEKFRFTIITDRLIRLEYNDCGLFVNNKTELISNRNLGKVKFEYEENERYLLIRTKYFKVIYVRNKPFDGGKMNPISNLKIELLDTDKAWYYNHPEVRNYGAPLYSFENSRDKLKTKHGLYSVEGFASIDDSSSLIMDENGGLVNRSTKGIDIYLFMYKDNFLGALADYFKITGCPPLIPRYALGNWWSKNISYNDYSVKDLVDTFSDKEIPFSVLLLNDEWHLNNYKDKTITSGFTWNNQLFQNPVSMTNYLHANNIRLGLNINPVEGIYPYERNFANFSNLIQNNEEIIPFNLFNPYFVRAFFQYFINPLNNEGVDFYSFDFDEVKNRDLLWTLNDFYYKYGTLNYNKRPFLITKNSNYGEHRYPVTYSGKSIVSWDTLKLIPKYNMLATNNGNSFWAHDIGGYYKGVEDNELYTRFVQLGVFSPILKFGSDKGKFYKREPYEWSYKTYKITKDFLNLRHNLIPYIYSEAYKYHSDFIPLIKPLYYEQPEVYDDPTYNSEYYFGSEFFISPILKVKDYVMNRVIHRFYLPVGTWCDYFTGKKFVGGKQYLSFFKDQDYPVFVKEGSIIPLAHNENINDTSVPTNMEIQIFPGQSNVYKLYEDDGVTNAYKNNNYLISTIDFTYSKNDYKVSIKPSEGKQGVIPERRNYKFNFKNTKLAPDVKVFLNTTEIPFKKYSKKNSLIIEVNNVLTSAQLTVICKGENIEISSERIFMNDIESIIADLQIKTELKEKIDLIINSDLPIKKKRIEIRKLEGKGMERKFMKLFLKLLEYLES